MRASSEAANSSSWLSVQFAIFDRGDQEGAARQVAAQILRQCRSLRSGDLLYFIGRWKTAVLEPEAAVSKAATDR